MSKDFKLQCSEFLKEELDAIQETDSLKEYNKVLCSFFESFDLGLLTLSEEECHLTRQIMSKRLMDTRMLVTKSGINKVLVLMNSVAVQNAANDEVDMYNESIRKLLEDLQGLSKEIAAKVIQRAVYISAYIPLRTFHSVEDLDMRLLAKNEIGEIHQSRIAPQVFTFSKFDEHPYKESIVFKDNKTDEQFATEESKLYVKFPLKSNDFIPTVIRIENKDGKDYVVKNDKAKYKKLIKRSVVTPFFL